MEWAWVPLLGVGLTIGYNLWSRRKKAKNAEAERRRWLDPILWEIVLQQEMLAKVLGEAGRTLRPDESGIRSSFFAFPHETWDATRDKVEHHAPAPDFLAAVKSTYAVMEAFRSEMASIQDAPRVQGSGAIVMVPHPDERGVMRWSAPAGASRTVGMSSLQVRRLVETYGTAAMRARLEAARVGSFHGRHTSPYWIWNDQNLILEVPEAQPSPIVGEPAGILESARR